MKIKNETICSYLCKVCSIQSKSLNPSTAGSPVFTKPLQKQSVRDYDDCTLKVRCDGVPKPDVLWYRDGEEISNDERHTVTTEVGGQVDSELEIKHFNASDAGKVISKTGQEQESALIIQVASEQKLDQFRARQI